MGPQNESFVSELKKQTEVINAKPNLREPNFKNIESLVDYHTNTPRTEVKVGEALQSVDVEKVREFNLKLQGFGQSVSAATGALKDAVRPVQEFTRAMSERRRNGVLTGGARGAYQQAPAGWHAPRRELSPVERAAKRSKRKAQRKARKANR